MIMAMLSCPLGLLTCTSIWTSLAESIGKVWKFQIAPHVIPDLYSTLAACTGFHLRLAFAADIASALLDAIGQQCIWHSNTHTIWSVSPMTSQLLTSHPKAAAAKCFLAESHTSSHVYDHALTCLYVQVKAHCFMWLCRHCCSHISSSNWGCNYPV